MDISIKIKKLTNSLLLSGLIGLVASCTDDNQISQGGSGYVQFKIYKEASYGEQAASRAGANQLDSLYAAKKVKVLLSNDSFNFSQTLNLNAYDEESAEYGLRSDKLELQPGEYTIDAYYLYGKTENQLYAGQPAEKTTFSITSGSLVVQDLLADVVGRGSVKFRLVKNIMSSRAADADTEPYPFSSIDKVDITVRNVSTGRTQKFEKLEVEYLEDFVDDESSDKRTSVGVIDSLLYIQTGTYELVSYTAYDGSTTLQYYNDEVLKETTFTVYDNANTETDVPVNLVETAANIKDYIALKAIWDAMGGEDWSYKGQTYANGVNWDFNKDIDMWGEQPGVGLDNNGRVISLSIGDFGAKGVVPAQIGELSELQTLMLGTHNDLLGYGAGDGQSALANMKGELTAAKLEKIRSDYMDNFVARDLRDDLSEPLKMAMEIKGDYTRKAARKSVSPKDVNWGDLTNGITGIHPAIGKLKKLEVLYIANAPIEELPTATTGNETEEPGFAGLTALTDLEIYNCPKMVQFPKVIADLPELIQLNLAMNRQMTSEVINDGIKALATGESREKLQMVYLGYNNISELPKEISGMKKLGKIDLIYNKLTALPAFGEDVNLVQATFDYNEIATIGTVEPSDGGKAIFCGMDDVESISFAHNKLTALPDIFDVNSIYTMASVNFSYNEIEDTKGFSGINTADLSLAGNKLTSFPKELFQTGSPLTVLNLSANKISTFNKGDLKGENTYMLTTLDLTYNRLKELPEDFRGETLPFLYGLDISGNQLDGFPWGALNISYLTVLSLRNQRDDDGNRTMSEWPETVGNHKGLQALFLGGNDIGKVPETEQLSYLISTLDVSDNPNLILNVSSVCPYIEAGYYILIYDRTQDIRGCDALELD